MSGLPRRARIRRSGDFRLIQRAGRRTTTSTLVVCYRRGNHDSPRFGLTVSRKVGNAVIRNRVKRWLREAIRAEQHRLDDLGGVDVVLIARRRAANAGADGLRAELAAALGIVGLA